jgi:hypothetical protein
VIALVPSQLPQCLPDGKCSKNLGGRTFGCARKTSAKWAFLRPYCWRPDLPTVRSEAAASPISDQTIVGGESLFLSEARRLVRRLNFLGNREGPPWPRGSSLPFDINFARRRPHLAPDHFRDPLYDAQMWALRFVRRCGRRVKPHVAQDRQNFGTDGVADPDRVEGRARACLSASASALKRDCAGTRAAGSCGRRISEPAPWAAL